MTHETSSSHRARRSCRAAPAACQLGSGRLGGASPSGSAGAIAVRLEPCHPHRPCHPSALRGRAGAANHLDQRSAADNTDNDTAGRLACCQLARAPRPRLQRRSHMFEAARSPPWTIPAINAAASIPSCIARRPVCLGSHRQLSSRQPRPLLSFRIGKLV